MNSKQEEDEFVNTKKAVQLLQITSKTLRIWDKENKIRTIRTPSGIRRYNLKDIQNILSCSISPEEQRKENKQKVCYARVSSQKQMDDLNRQKDFFKTKFPDHILVTDVASGINWKRKGLQTLLEHSMSGNISEIVVAHRDRLCRFAFELLEWIFKKNGVKLVVLNGNNEQSEDQELADDVLSIIHIYSCRKNGKRRYKKDKENTSVSN
jgi:predicted site-specific integrase-resolvase